VRRLIQKKKMRLVALSIVVLLPLAASERCTASSIALHCIARCAGLNATATVSSNPPPEQVLAPPSAEALAQLENEAEGVKSREKRGRRSFSLFAQLVEGSALPHAGSPSVQAPPATTNFSDQTAYAPAHRALSPEQLMALLGPAGGLEWTPLSRATLHCVDGRHASGGLYAYGGDLGEFALGLSVLEHVAQREIGQAETTRLLEAWLHRLTQAGAGFGACIDAAALAQLGAAVGLGAQPLDLSNPPVRTSHSSKRQPEPGPEPDPEPDPDPDLELVRTTFPRH
jgi:hypothetical protein